MAHESLQKLSFALRLSHAPKRNIRIVTGIALILASLLIGVFTNMPHVLAFSNGQTESIVIGQSNLSSNVSGAGPSGLLSPEGIAFDSSGNLWVADAGNGRVLEFKAPLSTDEKASIVLGEPDFNTTTECFGESVIPASCLSTPTGLAFDSSGNLWVSDSTDSRVVEFKTPFATGENASMVLGQPNLTTSENPDQVPTASNFNPGEALGGMAFDSAGNIWVTDVGFNRVLEFNAPFSMGESASTVLGWSNFTAGIFQQSPPTASRLENPMGVHFDSSGNLWVADEHNNRVVEFAVTSSATSATTSTSSSSSTTSTPVPEFPAGALVVTCIVSVAIVALISRRFRVRPEITG